MKEKTILRVIQILCILSALITMFSIQKTYAKYYEQVGTTYATNIKRWVINVNEKNLHQEDTLSNVMTPQFFYDPNMTMNDGDNAILVPGRHGYFDFLIDYTSVDVSFKFEFDIEQLNQTEEGAESYLKDFEVYGYAVVDTDLEITETTKVTDIEGITTLTKNNGKYDLTGITQQIDITETEKQKRVLVLFKWNDDNNNVMNNFADTTFVGEEDATDGNDGLHTLLKYNVEITFTQTV